MTDQGNHIVLKCMNPECGMRYPCPSDHPRRGACPLCETRVETVGGYDAPPPAPERPKDPQGSLVGVLDNIRSALNVGTMMRSADGVALDHLYLGGLTAPADNPKVLKTALGAEQSVASTSCLDVTTCVSELRSEGFALWAIDYTPDSVPLQLIESRPERLAFVVGNELAGVDPALLAAADQRVHLDMLGAKTTLNVGVTFGTVAYWLRSLPVRED